MVLILAHGNMLYLVRLLSFTAWLTAMLVSASNQVSVLTSPVLYLLPPTLPTSPMRHFRGQSGLTMLTFGMLCLGCLCAAAGPPVVLQHGGKISPRWWGFQIKHLAAQGYPIIAIDTRAHGRSGDDPQVPLSYDLLANDTVALLTYLKVPRAAVVGWSDGANTALSLAMHHGDKIDRAFVFGANYRPDQLNITGLLGIPFLNDLQERMKNEYEALSPTPSNFLAFKTKVDAMQAVFPDWDGTSFAQIETLSEPSRCANYLDRRWRLGGNRPTLGCWGDEGYDLGFEPRAPSPCWTFWASARSGDVQCSSGSMARGRSSVI